MEEYGAVLQNQPVDVSGEFARQDNHFFIGSKVLEFDPSTASGRIFWKGLSLMQRVSYHQLTLQFEDYKIWEDLPSGEYEDDQDFAFSISFVTPRTVRLRVAARPRPSPDEPSLVLEGEPPTDDSWGFDENGLSTTFTGSHGSITVNGDPVRFEFRDASGRLLTRTWNLADTRAMVNTRPTPFSFVRDSSNLRRHIAASFTLSPDEKLFGGGESFTRLNKRGQRLVLWTYDAYSVQTPDMYKPVPFFMSSRGYGMFVHTSAPLTLDLGGSYDGANSVPTAAAMGCLLGNPGSTAKNSLTTSGASWSSGTGSCPTSTPRPLSPAETATPCCAPSSSNIRRIRPPGSSKMSTSSAPTSSSPRSWKTRQTAVYLPPGLWIDYQTGEAYGGASWHRIRAGEIPTVILVRDGAAIPHLRLAQSTAWMDWGEIELVVYGGRSTTAEGLFCLPEGGALHSLRLEREGDGFVLRDDLLEGEVEWNVRAFDTGSRRDD